MTPDPDDFNLFEAEESLARRTAELLAGQTLPAELEAPAGNCWAATTSCCARPGN